MDLSCSADSVELAGPKLGDIVQTKHAITYRKHRAGPLLVALRDHDKYSDLAFAVLIFCSRQTFAAARGGSARDAPTLERRQSVRPERTQGLRWSWGSGLSVSSANASRMGMAEEADSREQLAKYSPALCAASSTSYSHGCWIDLVAKEWLLLSHSCSASPRMERIPAFHRRAVVDGKRAPRINFHNNARLSPRACAHHPRLGVDSYWLNALPSRARWPRRWADAAGFSTNRTCRWLARHRRDGAAALAARSRWVERYRNLVAVTHCFGGVGVPAHE